MVLIRTPVDQTIFVKPHVQALANALNEEFGLTNFGTYLGHSPPEGPTQALDIFTPDSPSGYLLQDRICKWLRENTKRFGCRYHIRRHQIWNIERADEGYREQGVTGNRTTDHMDHVHDTSYAYAPGPFGSTTEPPQQPSVLQGEDMLIFNVENTGIFLQRGDSVQHLLHPDHVLAFVKIGVPYQDKVELPLTVADSYLNFHPVIGVRGLAEKLIPGKESANASEFSYIEMLQQVRAGVDQMKEDYYRMMTEA
jgi:hypothetical protein